MVEFVAVIEGEVEEELEEEVMVEPSCALLVYRVALMLVFSWTSS